jgi:hypothetical protein
MYAHTNNQGNTIFFTLYLHNMFPPWTGSSSGAPNTWTQSYDFDLQRQRCKFLQRHW